MDEKIVYLEEYLKLKEILQTNDSIEKANKGTLIKAIIKTNDLKGLNLLLDADFINSKNVDKYLNFAINSGKYDLVPKLIERKNI